MALAHTAKISEHVPLVADGRGAVRVAETRVPLEVVVEAFRWGASAEEIVDAYPSLDLPDVYAILTYYLRHRRDVDEYVAERQRSAEELRTRIEREWPSAGRRERMLARRAALPPMGSC